MRFGWSDEADLEQLQKVQAGDTIVVRTYEGWAHHWRTCEVARVTGHRIYCTNIWAFRKSDGRQYGGLMTSPAWAFPGTPEYLEKVKEYERAKAEQALRRELQHYLRNHNFRDTPIDRLTLAVAILKGEATTFAQAIKIAWDAVNDMGRLAPSEAAALEAFEQLEENLDEHIYALEDYGGGDS